MLEQFLHFAGIPTLIGLVAIYFAYRVMVLKDIKAIRGKGKPEPRTKRDTAETQEGCSYFSRWALF